MTNNSPKPQNLMPLPGANQEVARTPRLGGIDIDQICELDRQNMFYELTYTAGDPRSPREQTPQTVSDFLTYPDLNFESLADYAAKFNAFFLITVSREPNNTDTWTVMPAFNDKKLWSGYVTERYAEKLKDAWAHVIIDPGEAARQSYSDSEQLGIKDEYMSRGMIAVDASTDGLHWDVYDMGRGTLRIEEGGWGDWHYGLNNTPGNRNTDYEYSGDVVQIKQLGRQALIIPGRS